MASFSGSIFRSKHGSLIALLVAVLNREALMPFSNRPILLQNKVERRCCSQMPLNKKIAPQAAQESNCILKRQLRVGAGDPKTRQKPVMLLM
jgi:hypothetical protein